METEEGDVLTAKQIKELQKRNAQLNVSSKNNHFGKVYISEVVSIFIEKY